MEMHIWTGTLTAQRYAEDILRPYVLPYTADLFGWHIAVRLVTIQGLEIALLEEQNTSPKFLLTTSSRSMESNVQQFYVFEGIAHIVKKISSLFQFFNNKLALLFWFLHSQLTQQLIAYIRLCRECHFSFDLPRR